MSARQQRGRSVPRRSKAAPRTFYIILAAIAVVGIAAIGVLILRGRQQTAVGGALLNRPPLTAPTGQTPEGYPYKGSPEAPVTVIEYSDFQCPFCGRFATTQALTLDQSYVETGKVRYVFHDYPLPQHANAIPAAEAARCAADQNAFWPMHDLLFANQRQWENLAQPLAQFAAYADQLKLNGETFTQCITSGKHTAEIQKAQQEGNQLHIPGTPTFIIDGQQYDAQQILPAIDAALAAKR